MFPITLDTSLLPVAVIGNGVATHRRLQLFQAAGAQHLTHFKEMPEEPALSGFKIAFVADFDEATSLQIYQKLKALGLLVNIEDKRPLCDFHVPAIVRRGNIWRNYFRQFGRSGLRRLVQSVANGARRGSIFRRLLTIRINF